MNNILLITVLIFIAYVVFVAYFAHKISYKNKKSIREVTPHATPSLRPDDLSSQIAKNCSPLIINDNLILRWLTPSAKDTVSVRIYEENITDPKTITLIHSIECQANMVYEFGEGLSFKNRYKIVANIKGEVDGVKKSIRYIENKTNEFQDVKVAYDDALESAVIAFRLPQNGQVDKVRVYAKGVTESSPRRIYNKSPDGENQVVHKTSKSRIYWLSYLDFSGHESEKILVGSVSVEL